MASPVEKERLPASIKRLLRLRLLLGPLTVLTGVLLWSYARFLIGCVERWIEDPEYWYGLLVPMVALGFAVRSCARPVACKVDAGGLVLIAIGIALRFLSARFESHFLEGVSLLVSLAGVVIVCGGRGLLRRLAPSILFLLFLLPLPGRLDTTLAEPLQRLVTGLGTYLLQTFGLAAVSVRNLVLVGDAKLDVAAVCSGVCGLAGFFMISTVVVVITNRSWWERVVIVGSAAPIGIACLAMRVAVAGVVDGRLDASAAEIVFRLPGGMLMLVLAAIMFWSEVRLLDKLFLQTPALPLARGSSTKAAMPVVVEHSSAMVAAVSFEEGS